MSVSFPKVLALASIVLFGAVVGVALFKEKKIQTTNAITFGNAPLEIELDEDIAVITPAPIVIATDPTHIKQEPPNSTLQSSVITKGEEPLADIDRIDEFFNKGEPKLPIVETITYKSKISWQKGRPAWLSDYANYYKTSRHFIARSLNGKPDYFKQDLTEGARFNVFRLDKNFNFHLVIDLSRCKMWFYYHDIDTNENVLLKTYQVGLGRVDSAKASGLLTPLGTYTLGSKVAIYKPNVMGYFNNEKVEMIGIFGTRWIPFDCEVKDCTASAKGFGIHGDPWSLNSEGKLVEDNSSIGKYQSDGCIRLATADIEELFAIVITKPTIVELVKDFHEAKDEQGNKLNILTAPKPRG